MSGGKSAKKLGLRPKNKICLTNNCRKPAKRGNFCYSCRVRRYKEKNPEYYAFYVLKNNAKRRGVVFGLTFDDFLKFAVKTDYMKNKGTSATSYHIDRKDERKGYFKGNIQVLENAKNIQKYLAWSQGENGAPSGFKVRKKVDVPQTDDHPF